MLSLGKSTSVLLVSRIPLFCGWVSASSCSTNGLSSYYAGVLNFLPFCACFLQTVLWKRKFTLTVSEDTLNKNLSAMSKSLKQLQIDVKNAQNDKMAPHNDQFAKVMGDFLNTAKVSPAFQDIS